MQHVKSTGSAPFFQIYNKGIHNFSLSYQVQNAESLIYQILSTLPGVNGPSLLFLGRLIQRLKLRDDGTFEPVRITTERFSRSLGISTRNADYKFRLWKALGIIETVKSFSDDKHTNTYYLTPQFQRITINYMVLDWEAIRKNCGKQSAKIAESYIIDNLISNSKGRQPLLNFLQNVPPTTFKPVKEKILSITETPPDPVKREEVPRCPQPNAEQASPTMRCNTKNHGGKWRESAEVGFLFDFLTIHGTSAQLTLLVNRAAGHEGKLKQLFKDFKDANVGVTKDNPFLMVNEFLRYFDKAKAEGFKKFKNDPSAIKAAGNCSNNDHLGKYGAINYEVN